jgi:hypothetical protein
VVEELHHVSRSTRRSRPARDDRPSFAHRARTDLVGTLAAEGIHLSPDELAAARSFHREIAGLSADEIGARLAAANADQGLK